MKIPIHCSPNLRPRWGGWTACNEWDYRHTEAGWTATYVAPRPQHPTATWGIRDENNTLIAVIYFPWELP